MIKSPFILFFGAILFSNISFAQTSFQRTKYNFNTDWKVSVGDLKDAESANFEDSGWKKVTLPYAWNEDDAFKKDIAEHSTGIAWYISYRSHTRPSYHQL